MLKEEGNFSQALLSDQIALYAVYMPTLRVEIKSFVHTWNIHRIRKQAHRPTVIHGKPYMNYYHPAQGVQNRGICPDSEALETLQSTVQDWGLYHILS